MDPSSEAVASRPVGGYVNAVRGIDDADPITMSHGTTTRIGAPQGKRLYVETRSPTVRYSVAVIHWHS